MNFQCNTAIKTIIIIFLGYFLSGCAGTSGYSSQNDTRIVGQDNAGDAQLQIAANQLFTANGEVFSINFCEADVMTEECIDDKTPSALGLGGLFVPLVLNLNSIGIEQWTQNEDASIEFISRLNAPVNKVPAACGKVDGKIVLEQRRISMMLPSNYCNWMAIGNVAQSMSFSFTSIDLASKRFSGYYKIAFYGTGNATGSGFFSATISSDKELAKP